MNALGARLRVLADAAAQVDAEVGRQRVEPRADERAQAEAWLPSPDRRDDATFEAAVAQVDARALGALAERLRVLAWDLLGLLGGDDAQAERALDDEDARLTAAWARRCSACGSVRPLDWYANPFGGAGAAGQRTRCNACTWRPRAEDRP